MCRQVNNITLRFSKTVCSYVPYDVHNKQSLLTKQHSPIGPSNGNTALCDEGTQYLRTT
jgi:hypothetical protein